MKQAIYVAMDERDVEFPAKDVPLRNDVNTLGAIVGDVLIEQFGREVFDRVETLRLAAIARREQDHPDLTSLASQVAAVSYTHLTLPTIA